MRPTTVATRYLWACTMATLVMRWEANGEAREGFEGNRREKRAKAKHPDLNEQQTDAYERRLTYWHEH